MTNVGDGSRQWSYNSGAPILTSPAMSADRQTIFVGNEAIYAMAVNAASGVELWRTRLQGQSLSDRYPVVAGNTVLYRSQPLYFFHLLLHEGDNVMDQAGTRLSDWNADWINVRAKILNYLNTQPSKQTFFVLNAADGVIKGTAPVLYTYGNNDIPAPPVVSKQQAYVAYRARHGIQTDSNTVHVTTRYDAELGSFDPTSLNITGLHSNKPVAGQPEFRLTSDEPAMLTMGGQILWVDNWERAGGINITTGELIPLSIVSDDWPECAGDCSPGGINPFFPLVSGTPAYPFLSPRVTEGSQRGGIVIANGMLYWRVIQGGLGALSHKTGSTCPAPLVWSGPSGNDPILASSIPENLPATRALSEYVLLDLTTPAINPNPELVDKLIEQVNSITDTNSHMMPFYLERGFSPQDMWPYDTTSPPGPPKTGYINSGNIFWHDPGELLYSMALAYPYFNPTLQAKVKSYMSSEMNRYPPLSTMPWSSSPPPPWLVQGASRESYQVPFRSQLNNWPPPAPNFSVLYALWLWSKNTGDWSYAQNHWSGIRNFFNSHRNSINYYEDIAGAIGFARLAVHFNNSADFDAGNQAAIAGIQTGLNFDTFRLRAETQYPDYFKNPTEWYTPAFYGLTPEIGLYLREQLGGKAENYLLSKEVGDGLRWWYITRVGMHAESGETSFILPTAAWSHFLAHAYIVGNKQGDLISWLDRPWGRGDLYAIQKIVASIQALP